MASYFVTSIVEGQWFYTTDADPSGVISAPRGSVALRTDAGNESLYLNVTVGVGTSTNWSRVLSPDINKDLDLTGVDQITLADNANPALDIGSTGLLNLLRFITTNGAERMIYSGAQPFNIATGGLSVTGGSVALPNNTLDVGLAAIAALPGIVAASLTLRVTHPGGAAAVDTVLPARAGGYRVLDAMAVASAAGGAAAAVQVQTGAGVGVSSNLNLDNTVVAGTVSRTGILLNTVFASGATIRVQGINAPAASNVFITLAPL